MPVTENCPRCKRLAYMRGGVCEFCGFEEKERVAFSGTYILPEEPPYYFQESIDRRLFEAYDQLNAVFIELSYRKDTQHEAAELVRIIEGLGALRDDWKRHGH